MNLTLLLFETETTHAKDPNDPRTPLFSFYLCLSAPKIDADSFSFSFFAFSYSLFLPPPSAEAAPAGCMTCVVSPLLEIHCPLAGLPITNELLKVERSLLELNQRQTKLAELMANPNYSKVPVATKTKNEEQKSNDALEAEKLAASIANFKSVLTPEQSAQYILDKLASFEAEMGKLNAGLEKLVKALPVEKEKQPKKSLQKIAEAETEIKELQEQISKLKAQ